MQRRTALKNVASTIGAFVALPAWANGWNRQQLSNNALLNPAENSLLAEVVETIIPKTDTPGAKELGVHQFVQTMITDCYDKKAQDSLVSGLASLDAFSQSTFGKSFTACSAKQRIHILEGMELSDDAARKSFYGMVKGLTIQGYMSSEYVMTNLTHYEMIPGRFHGCVPVKTT
ncbi:gluconate 2-dehydrogenase subunit 3 family protein [Arundinibacter roseus]|uniref:Gluconate 2-dehydrogenase subunit 3 family protein n=1 Tax=Arundinibacter roseus TaxID=2070510 RepID=A0A4R4KIB2_9BACT|nr:gluconate 2-dehydrogenase subunit 3 family protein [Arundinibacter roseus]TDB67884.1 gluconate 2-dehydrogenase subunit 3 family protein [Arundinibacter roseus]